MARKFHFIEAYKDMPTSRVAASAIGFPYFYTGKQCSKGHYSTRYASSGNCVECISKTVANTTDNYRGRSSKRSAENQILAMQAADLGYTKYKSLTACKNGHFERFCTTNNCVECSNIANAKRKTIARWKRIEKEYGLSKDQFFQILDFQSSKCDICKCEISEKSSHIDHCHNSGMVRCLLCQKCNQAIGLFGDSVDKMKSAILYLEKHNAAS